MDKSEYNTSERMVMREGATYVTAGRRLGYAVVYTARQLDC